MICVFLFICLGPVGTTSLITEEQMTTMSPTAAAVSKIKPGMKLTEVCVVKYQCSNYRLYCKCSYLACKNEFSIDELQ